MSSVRGVLQTPPDDAPALQRYEPVPQLAERLSLSVRSLLRLFAGYVGVAPSWVIRRYRLHQAAVHATAGGEVDWARLALTLGHYDQAHLVREFTATVGTAPARYARRVQ